MWFGRLLALREFRGKLLVEALVTVPLVLPPTVLGFYLLVTFGARSPLGRAFEAIAGHTLPFSFQGLLLASAIANIPFVVQPIQRGFEAIPANVRDAAACCGLMWSGSGGVGTSSESSCCTSSSIRAGSGRSCTR